MVDPYEQLGLDPDRATDEMVHRAYMKAIHRHPPDRDPKTFEGIRTAYEQIRNERDRMRLRLFGLDPESFVDMLPETNERPRVGAEMWLAVIDVESKRRVGSLHHARKDR